MTFLKKNLPYVILALFIVLVNFLPRFESKRETVREIEKAESATAKTESLYVDFEESQARSEKIEALIGQDAPLYLLYLALNLAMIFIFLSGFGIDGYYVFAKIRGNETIKKTPGTTPAAWRIGDILRILILAFSGTYAFFIVFGFIAGLLRHFFNAGLSFYNNENFRMMFDTIILDLGVLGATLYLLRRGYGQDLRSFGFIRNGFGRNIAYGLAGYIGVIPIVTVLGIIVYVIVGFFKLKPPPQPIVELFLVEKNTWLVFTASAIASVFGPFIEEIFFRGVMYTAIKKKIGIVWAITLTSLLFSFLHTHAFEYFLVGFIPIAVLGAVLAYLYEKTGSLVPCITMHIMNNVGSVFMVFMFKYFNSLAG